MAGRIPEIVIQDLISRTDLGTLIGESVALKRSGQNYSGLCPFHEEKTPSFTVSPIKNFYYCFGCSASGNAVNFLMDYHHMSFVAACENLATRLGIAIQYEDGQTPKKQKKPDEHLLHASKVAQDFFRNTLKALPEHHPVKKYLHKRTITEQSQESFGIGFAPPGWENLKNHLAQNNISERTALEIGLLTQGKNGKVYDRFRARIMFPIRDIKGNTIAFGGRVMNDEQPKYLNSPESPIFQKRHALFGLSEVVKAGKLDKVLVTEGYLDVIRMHQVGLPYALAALGTATSDSHIKTMFRLSDHIVACFDGDNAGAKAAWRLLEHGMGIIQSHQKIEFLFLPQGQDPDSFIAEHGKNAFLAEEKNAHGLSEFFIAKLTEDLQMHQMDDRAKFLKRALPIVNTIEKSMLKDLLIQKLSEISQLPVDRLETMMQSLGPQGNYYSPQQSQQNQSHQGQHQQGGYEQQDYYSNQQNSQHNWQQNNNWQQDNRNNNYQGRQNQPYQKGKGKYKNYKNYQKPAPVALPRSQTLIDAMLRLLLQQPELARTNQMQLETSPHITGFDLFQATYEQLRENPEASPGYLMGLWHNEPKGEHIARLAAEEFLIPQNSFDIEFTDGLYQIESIALNQALTEVAKTKPIDKEKLRILLEKKQIREQQK